jgi:hypothetical protein
MPLQMMLKAVGQSIVFSEKRLAYLWQPHACSFSLLMVNGFACP